MKSGRLKKTDPTRTSLSLFSVVEIEWRPQRLLATAVAAWLLVGAAGCRYLRTASEEKDPTPVIAELNGAPVHASAFDRFVKARLSDIASSQIDLDLQRSSLLDEFIQRRLVVREAQDQNIVPTDEEISRELESQYKQTTGDGTEQNATVLQSTERRYEIGEDLLALTFYNKKVVNDVGVTPAEVEADYAARRAEYEGKNGFYVREIRVFEEAEAERLYRQSLAKPDDFAVLAKEHSDAPTAARGGLIYYEVDQLPASLEQAIAPLKVGSISRVVRSNFGYHIFKLERRAEPLPFEKVQREIETRLLSEKKQALIDAFNQRLVESARIRIYADRLGFSYRGRFPTS
jgi:parvulin-like peptidyl-prolyl isomerase